MIKTIETEWKGYKFRSRLEARWAVFFDSCGIDWDYEVEGFELPNGNRYLPDFTLYGIKSNSFKNCVERRWGRKAYVEVKGVWDERDADKVYDFADPDSTADRLVLCVGGIPKQDPFGCAWRSEKNEYEKSQSNFLMNFNMNCIFLADDPWFFCMDEGCLFFEPEEGLHGRSCFKEYEIARKARFEFL